MNDVAKQTTTLLGLGHLFFTVSDLALPAEELEHLGFVLQPEAAHGPELGTRNRLAMLPQDYIELITPTAPTPIGQLLQADLQRRGNHLGAIVFSTASMVGTLSELRAAGFEIPEPITYTRPVDLPDRQETARFTTGQIPHFERYGVRVLIIEHATPDLVWYDVPVHRNGATAITGLTIATDEVAEARRDFARLFGLTAGTALEVGRVTIEIVRAIQSAGVIEVSLSTSQPSRDVWLQSTAPGVQLRLRYGAN